MNFIVENKVFEVLPEVCFGVVVAKDLDNSGSKKEILDLLDQAIQETRNKFRKIKPKEHPDLTPYREALRKMNINPNKFPCSVEALTNRVVKGGSPPDINPIVNLVNAFSLKYTLPMGAHDLSAAPGNIEVRFSRDNDRFTPFGQDESESPDQDELVYARGSDIKTRKWIWRQSDLGKVTADSRNIFIPIDGLFNNNYDSVIAARDELATTIEKLFNVGTTVHYFDKDNQAVQLIM